MDADLSIKYYGAGVESHTESYARRLEGKSLAEKVEILAEIRDEEGYMAEFTEDDEDYLLVEHNCPIVSIAEEYPHVCETELALFRRSLGAKRFTAKNIS